jgi:hypothetical protein
MDLSLLFVRRMRASDHFKPTAAKFVVARGEFVFCHFEV